MRFLMNFSTDFSRALCSRFLIMRIFLLAIFFFFGNLCCFWCLCFSFRFDLILFCFCCDDKGCYRFWVFVFLDLIWMICICFFGNTYFFFLVFDCTDFGAGITGVFCACDVDLFGLCLCGWWKSRQRLRESCCWFPCWLKMRFAVDLGELFFFFFLLICFSLFLSCVLPVF